MYSRKRYISGQEKPVIEEKAKIGACITKQKPLMTELPGENSQPVSKKGGKKKGFSAPIERERKRRSLKRKGMQVHWKGRTESRPPFSAEKERNERVP